MSDDGKEWLVVETKDIYHMEAEGWRVATVGEMAREPGGRVQFAAVVSLPDGAAGYVMVRDKR